MTLLAKKPKLKLPKGTKMTDAKEEVNPQTLAPAPAPAPEEATADPLLVQILSTRRAHSSAGDINFRLWLFNYIKSKLNLAPTIEVEGNILVQTDPKSTVLFSCHVDTVHSSAESNGQSQQLAFDPAFGHLFLADKKASGCLGGDDGCGVYILLKMLEAGVKGKFIFHTGEERGGIGSNAFVKARKQFCEDVEMVVAFDRAVKSGENPEVILTQGGNACASLEFGKALCAELNKVEFEYPYVISHGGSFTDSKVYRYLVPECVNIGCFYESQHGPNEYVDVNGLELLVKAACQVNWGNLPIIRNPAKVETPTFGKGTHVGKGGYGGYDDFDMFDWSKSKQGQSKLPPFKPQIPEPTMTLLQELDTFRYEDFMVFVTDEPEDAVNALMELMLKLRGVEAELASAKTMLGL